MISVIMSTYNETESELRSSIESVLNQTYTDIEYVVVNDNPENTMIARILSEYADRDNRIKIVHNKKNIGLSKSLNRAIQKSSGEFIARMDADDISLPTRLADQMEYMLLNGLDFVSGNAVLIDENGDEYPDEKQSIIRETKHLGRTLLCGCMVYHPSVLVRANILKGLNGYRDVVPAEDYDLWLRIYSNKYKMACMGKRIIKYRVRRNSISRQNQYKQYLTSKYVLGLYKQRRKSGGKDNFTLQNFQNYLLEHGVNDPQKHENYQYAKSRYDNMVVQLKSKNIYGFTKELVVSMWRSPLSIEMLKNAVRMKIAVK